MPYVLTGVGALLILLTLLLAFTIFGMISAVLGIAFIVAGAAMLGRRRRGRDTGLSS
jgi:membrane protein implicated in regulation of membrane protease activity